MIAISYFQMVVAISIIWLIVRGICWKKNKKIDLKREAQLLLVYICVVVVVRFTFCPFGLVDGRIGPLFFDASRIYPPRINVVPFVYLFDYQTLKEALLNLIGNTAMFIPLGIVWPSAFKRLDTHFKVIGAGVGVTLFIEILQLFFFDRATDIDDIILNSLGYLIGYAVYLLFGRVRRK